MPVASNPGEAPDAQMAAFGKLAQSLDVKATHDDGDELDKFIKGSPCRTAASPLA